MRGNIKLPDGYFCPLFHVRKTASTNDLALAYGKSRGGDAVFLADRQTNGRGRGDHSFLSPVGGLYVSYLFHPDGAAEKTHITVAAAVAVTEALRDVCGIHARVKWVNDVYLDGRKAAGILAEGAVEDGGYRFAVVGIGINLKDVCGKIGIADIATSVEEKNGIVPKRRVLLTAVLSRFREALANEEETMKKYKDACFVIGTDVEVSDGEAVYDAHVTGMTEDGALVLRMTDGREKILHAGEVHIRQISKK